jgi:hypothetical protein
MNAMYDRVQKIRGSNVKNQTARDIVGFIVQVGGRCRT